MDQPLKTQSQKSQQKPQRIAYLDCPTGIAGDMCLGALISAGVPLDYLIQGLAPLGLTGEYRLWSEIKKLGGQVATKVHVDLTIPSPTLGAIAGHNLHHHEAAPRPAPATSANPGEVLGSPATNSGDLGANHQNLQDMALNSSSESPHPDHWHAPTAMHSHPPVRTLGDITQLIQGATLPSPVVHKSLAIFQTLAAAEAAVHGSTLEAVHFHEVGATDALVDIVGTCLGLHWLGIEALYCSALPTGGGTVWAAHGRLPVPAPAVLQLLAQGRVPIYGNGLDRELVTPTGAAIVVALAQGFGPCPPLVLDRVGLGAGNHDLPIPNILRLWIGDSAQPRATIDRATHHSHAPFSAHSGHSAHAHTHTHTSHSNPASHASSHSGHSHDSSHSSDPSSHSSTPANHSSPASHSPGHASHSAPSPDSHHLSSTSPAHSPASPSPTSPPSPTLASPSETPTTVTLLQTQLDDLSPQAIAYVTEELLQLGALDVFTQAITMKKGRSGLLLSVIASEALVSACEALIFRETSTLGIRRLVQERRVLQRRIDRVSTPYGPVAVKVAWDPHLGSDPQQPLNVQPEYEDCAAIARQHHVPWQTIHRQALQAWFNTP